MRKEEEDDCRGRNDATLIVNDETEPTVSDEQFAKMELAAQRRDVARLFILLETTRGRE